MKNTLLFAGDPYQHRFPKRSFRHFLGLIGLLCLFIRPAQAQDSWSFCLSAGTADGTSYAFLSPIITADSLLNSKVVMARQFQEELMLNYTQLYEQNSYRFEAVQVERHHRSSDAINRRTQILDKLKARGFTVVEVPFTFYADSLDGQVLATNNTLSRLHQDILEKKLHIKKKRAEVESTPAYINRRKAMAANWVEKHPGTCKAGGPPPLCPDDHWEKMDSRAARSSYEAAVAHAMNEEVLKLDQLEKVYRQEARKAMRKHKQVDTVIHKSFYYFPKAINAGLHMMLAGQVFSSPKVSDRDAAALSGFILSIKTKHGDLYKAGELTIYDLSGPYDSWSAAMASRRQMMSHYKYLQNYKATPILFFADLPAGLPQRD